MPSDHIHKTPAAEKKPDSSVWPRVLFVSAGEFRAHDSPNVLFIELFRLDELEQPVRSEPYIYSSNRKTKGLRLGGVYSIEAKTEEDGRHFIRPQTAEFIREWDNPQEVAGWRLRQDGAHVALRMTKHEKQLTDRKEQLKILEPLRKTYMRADRLGKRALEVAVIAFLRGEQL